MTDLELHDWALQRYGSEDLANKGAIVQQLHQDDQQDDPGTLHYVPDLPQGPPQVSVLRSAPRDRTLARFP